jgi:tight adherence protein B
MKFDSHLVFLILVFAAVFAAGQSVIGLVSVARQKRKVNRRLKVAERVDGVSALVMELRKQRGLDAKGERGRRLRWLSNLIVASGLRYEPKKWTVYAILAGLVGGMAAAVLLKNPLLFPVGVVVFGVGGPLFYLKHLVKKRAKALGFQLPQALEIIVRSLEAGHPVPTAISLVGREMVDPVGTEFGMAADEIAYGATMAQRQHRSRAPQNAAEDPGRLVGGPRLGDDPDLGALCRHGLHHNLLAAFLRRRDS